MIYISGFFLNDIKVHRLETQFLEYFYIVSLEFNGHKGPNIHLEDLSKVIVKIESDTVKDILNNGVII